MPYRKVDFPSTFKKIIVTGKGQVTVTPDLAILQLGVQTTGEDVTEAQSENARISQNVLDSIRQLGITDIKTYQYSINKIIDYVDGRQIDRGYQVSNIIEIRTEDLNNVGTIIDTAVQNGANKVNSVNFDVAQPQLYYQEALNLAVDNAIQKAQSIVMGLGIMMTPIPILITENSNVPIPYQGAIAFREGAVATPIESGNKQIDASVTVELIY